MDISVIEEKMSDEFTKFHLKGFPFDAVVHKFTEPDKGYPHDHPFGFQSHVLKGSYIERIYCRYKLTFLDVTRKAGDSFFVPATHIHQIIDLPDGECYTIITPLHKERESGFWKFEDGKAYFNQWNEPEFKEVK